MTNPPLARLRKKYDAATQNLRRHPLFGRRSKKWNNRCHKLARKLNFEHHPFLLPPWHPKTTRDKSIQL